MKGREWERVSIDAWDYGRFGDYESWTVIAKAVGTAGNMAKYAYCREVHEVGEVNLFYLSDAEVE